jgi:hypothetical protein
VVRFSGVTGDRNHLFVVGNDLRGATIVPGRTLFLRDLHGKAIPRPTGNFTFAFPKAAWDGAGKLRLLWGEPDAAQPPETLSQWNLQVIRTIWTATLDVASGVWSQPTRIGQTRFFPLDWSWAVQDPSLARSEPAVAVLMPVTDPVGPAAAPAGEAGSRVWMFSLHRGEWITTTVPLAGRVTSAQANFGPSVVTLAYISAARTDAEPNRVIVVRSLDHGATWSTPVTLGEAPKRIPLRALSVLADDKRLHIMWKQQTSAGSYVLRHRQSSNGGEPGWSDSSDLPIPANTGNESAVLDACGSVHVVFGALGDGRRLELRHATFSDHWSQPMRLFDSLVTYGGRLSATQDGTVWLTFIGAPPDATSPDQMATYIAELGVR